MPSPLRTLLVEDDRAIRELTRYSVEREGRFVVVGEAADADMGVRLAGELEPQIVLLDLLMPVKSGLDALPSIRRAAPESHIVVLSMLERPGIREAVIARGADAFLDKSLDSEDIEKRLWELCVGPTLTMADLMQPESKELVGPSKTLNARSR